MKLLLTLFAIAFSLFASSQINIERSGCCSHHGGVDGCLGGRVVCNDGSISPSCTCKGGGSIDKSVCNQQDKNSSRS